MAPNRRAIPTKAELEERIAKLPGWAQSHISDLQRLVNEQARRLQALTERPESNTLANPYEDKRTGEQPLYLDQDAQVEFSLGGKYDRIRVGVQRDRYHGEYLHIMADRALILEFDSANTFRLKMRD